MRTARSTGAARLRSLCQDQEVLRAHGERASPDVSHTVFRPSIILGDSRFAQTTQFDVVRSFVFLAGLPFLPFNPTDKLDIVNVDFVAESIVAIHQKDNPDHEIYHLSSGTDSQTFRELTDALSKARNKSGPLYLPGLEKPFTSVNNWLANIMRNNSIGYGATLLKVFIPYLVWNTVFDNTRITGETGKKPAPFPTYSYPLLKFSREGNFTYPYKDWPEDGKRRKSIFAAIVGGLIIYTRL
ncbi:MAG: SDR family oxidoreductase [Acidobacteria bacterium]|nr:SDR family oxidoreductase [Acidobacteriota bacterium]